MIDSDKFLAGVTSAVIYPLVPPVCGGHVPYRAYVGLGYDANWKDTAV